MFGYRWRWPMNEMKSELVQMMKLFLQRESDRSLVLYESRRLGKANAPSVITETLGQGSHIQVIFHADGLHTQT